MSSSVIFPAQPEQILKGLGKLWTTLGQEEKEQGKPTVLRACAMTLIVATDEQDGYGCAQTISELMRGHPSRGIVISISREAEHSLEARVLAQCWKPFGKAQQICCEQIEITAHPESWPNVGQTLVGLTVADLPVVFWCRHKAALRADATSEQKAGLQAVLDLSTKVVVDSSGYEPAAALELIARLQSSERAVADLEWSRLTPWRQPVAQLFDNPARTNKLSDFTNIEVTYGGEHLPPSALYFAAWLSQPYRAKVKWTRVDSANSGLQSLAMMAGDETITIERTGKDCVRLYSTNGRERTYSVPDLPAHTLLEEELSLAGRDPAFDHAFERAKELLIAE